MKLQWTPIDDIIAELEVTYNINSNNYIHKLPVWITQALANYAVFIPMEVAITEIVVESEDIVYLPPDVKSICAVSYNNINILRGRGLKNYNTIDYTTYNSMLSVTGFQVEITVDEDGNQISKHRTDIQFPLDSSVFAEYRYYINNPRMLTLDFGQKDMTGEKVKVYYIRLPHSRDVNTGQYLPMIPDNEIIKQNITWFILRNLLYSGYSHPILNLGAAMPYLNPAKMYDDTMPKARSQFLVSDKADLNSFKNLFTVLIQNYRDSSANLNEH